MLSICSLSHGAITGQWVVHPTFDNSVNRVLDTPGRVYFMGYNQQVAPAIAAKSSTDQTLFYYDKEGDEIIAAAKHHPLSSTSVDKIEYNPDKKYLLILYKNQDIDLLYDNGDVVNIPALLHADIPGSRVVNAISFYPWKDHIWLATDFGYVIINDKKQEVEDSRNYGVKISAATELGGKVLLCTDNNTYIAPISSPRLNISDYSRTTVIPGANMLWPLSETKLIANTFTSTAANQNTIRTIQLEGDELKELLLNNPWGPVTFCPSEFGLTLIYSTRCIGYDRAPGNVVTIKTRPTQDHNIYSSATWDQKEYFTALPRKGLRSIVADDQGNGTLTRDFMLPNAPNAYWSRGMAYHPTYGMLVNSHGQESVFATESANSISEPILLSAYKNGHWTPMSPAYTYPEQTMVGYNPYGLAIDPNDNRYVYSGSPFSGMVRLNLSDPKDIIHYTHPRDATSKLPGYVEAAETQSNWTRLCHFSEPYFDSNNILWTQFSVHTDNNLELRYLTPEDRRATTSAATARPWRKLVITGVENKGLNSRMVVLKSSQNRNLIAHFSTEGVLIYDTNGTPDNTSDDRKAFIPATIYDQDGGEINLYGVNSFCEDPETGFLWFGTYRGVFYLQPQAILRGQTNFNRVKVARNDGTSLADYLLNGIGVNSIIIDPQGRKWFGTTGAGIVITSADGKTVYDELTTANSGLPSNIVYKICYNPDSNSMMISTEQGLCEFLLGATSAEGESTDKIRAFPNPVAPDYHGWVTIDGLPDNSLVKITDAYGNIVRELGVAESGSIQWDVLNMDYRRVNTGVYYVYASPASGSGSSKVAKILVMN